MDFRFHGYVEMPGEEFNLPGVIDVFPHGENVLYPVWTVFGDEAFWMSYSTGELYVCPVNKTETGWDADSDSSFWINAKGEISYQGCSDCFNADPSFIQACLRAVPDVRERCLLPTRVMALA